jgi:hypothetical protein
MSPRLLGSPVRHSGERRGYSLLRRTISRFPGPRTAKLCRVIRDPASESCRASATLNSLDPRWSLPSGRPAAGPGAGEAENMLRWTKTSQTPPISPSEDNRRRYPPPFRLPYLGRCPGPSKGRALEASDRGADVTVPVVANDSGWMWRPPAGVRTPGCREAARKARLSALRPAVATPTLRAEDQPETGPDRGWRRRCRTTRPARPRPSSVPERECG